MQDLTLDSTVSTTSYRLGLQAIDTQMLEQWTDKLMAAMRKDPMFTDVQSQALQFGNQIQLTFDRATASRLGVTPQAIDDVLYDAFGQRQVSTIYTQLNQYHVVLASDRQPRNLADLLTGLYVDTASGGVAPLSSMATQQVMRTRHHPQPPGPVSLRRRVLQPGAGADAGRRRHPPRADRAADLGLPITVQAQLEGAAATFQSSLGNQLFLVLAAIMVVYLMLGILYESFVHPVTILSTLLSAALGALLALLVTGTQFDIIGLIGIVLLIGIVMKNGIMMVDFALELQRNEGMQPAEAIRQAARTALPADPDDQHGLAVRRRAAGAGHRHRLGAASSAGYRHHWRPAAEPVADAVLHAGDFPGHERPGTAPGWRPPGH